MSHRSFIPLLALFIFLFPAAGLAQLETALWTHDDKGALFSALYINGNEQIVRIYELGDKDSSHWGDQELTKVRDGYQARYDMGFSTYVINIYPEDPAQLRVVTTIWYPDSTEPRVADYRLSKYEFSGESNRPKSTR